MGTVQGLLLFPGAGSGRESPALVAVDGAVSADMPVVRADFPYRREGRRGPPRAPHFPAITVPCLFVSGTRDPFGAPDELEAHTRAIAAPVTHVWVEGGRHELKGADANVE